MTQKLVKLKKLTDHNHDKYMTTPKFNPLTADVFNARLVQANLITKTDFDNKVSSLDSKVVANKPKITSDENKLEVLKRGLGISFSGSIIFDGGDGSQAYLIFQSRVKFNGSILRQPKVSYTHEKAVNVSIVTN